MVKYEIARQKAADAWLDATTPIICEAAVNEQVECLRAAARERLRAEARQDWAGAPGGGLAAHLEAIALPEATEAMRQAAIEAVWRVNRRARNSQFPISDNLSALMALVMADLSEAQRETLMNLILQRDIELTALTLQQLREFLITLFHAPKSSLEHPSWAHKSGPRSFISISYGELDQYEGHWVQDEITGDERFLDEHEDLFWVFDEDQCFWLKYPFQGRSLRKGGKSNGGKGKQGKSNQKHQRLAGFSSHTAKEEERARSLEREAVHLLARRMSPKKKLKKRRPRMMRC